MKESITKSDLALLDSMTMQADEAHGVHTGVVRSMCLVLGIDPNDDASEVQALDAYVRGGARQPIDELLGTLDVFVEESIDGT